MKTDAMSGAMAANSPPEAPLDGILVGKAKTKKGGDSPLEGTKSSTKHAKWHSATEEADLDMPSSMRSVVVLSEEKSRDHTDHFGHRCIFYESSTARRMWNVVITLMLAYTGTFFLYRLIFWECRIGGAFRDYDVDAWRVFDDIIYWVFCFDLLFGFFLSHTDEFGVEVDSIRRIARRYLANTFFINLLACIPESLIEWIIHHIFQFHEDGSGGGEPPGELNQVFRVVRLQRISRLFRLFRLTRLAKIRAHKDSECFKWFQSFKGVRVINLCFALAWIVHLLACGWYLTASLHDNAEDTWVARRPIDNSGENFLIDADPLDQWMTSMYFVLTVFTTVGYGDISAITMGEIVFASIIMVTGAVVHSIIISEVINVVTANDATNIFVRQKSDLCKAFAAHTELDVSTSAELNSWIQTNARLWVSNHYDREEMKDLITGKYMPRSLLGKLPDGLYDGRLIRNRVFSLCRFAGGVPPRLPTLLALAVHACKFQADELVYQVNDFPFNLFMVIEGTFSYAARPSTRGGQSQKQLAVSKEAASAAQDTAPQNNDQARSTWAKYVQGQRTNVSYADEDSHKFFPYQLFPPGTYFGDSEVFSGQPRLTTARCETPGGIVLSLHKTDLAKMCEEFPMFGHAWRIAAKRHARQRVHRLKQLTRGMSHRHLAACIIQKAVRANRFKQRDSSAKEDIVAEPKLAKIVDEQQHRGKMSIKGHIKKEESEIQDLRTEVGVLRRDMQRVLKAVGAELLPSEVVV